MSKVDLAAEIVELDQRQLAELRQIFESDFGAFCLALVGESHFDHDLHGRLCDFLQDPNCTEKVVVLARGWLKSTIVSIYILWRALKNPEIRILYTSNTATNAGKTIGELLGIVEKNLLIQSLWPDRIPETFNHHWSVQSACLKRESTWPEGTFESAGVGTNIVKRHYDIIVEDDSVAPTKDNMSGEEIMPTRDEIDKAVGFHKMTMPLLVDPATGERIVVNTRWPGEDHIHYIKHNEPSFKFFDVPAINAETGKTNYKRFNLKTLDKIRDSLGTFMFMALYMNDPQTSDKMGFKQSWIRYWDTLPTEGRKVLTVDPADPPTGKSSQDYSAFVSCIFNEQGLFIRRSSRERITGKEIVEKALNMAFEDGVDIIRVEVNKHAYLEQEFKDEMLRRRQFIYVEYVKTSRAKEARIMALQPLYESGRVFHNRVCRNLEAELVSFPNGRHDDEIDALAWQLESYVNVEQKAQKPVERKMDYKFEVTFEELMESISSRLPIRGQILSSARR